MYYDTQRAERTGPPVGRRAMRSLLRFRHRKVAGTYRVEPDCQHDLTVEPSDGDTRRSDWYRDERHEKRRRGQRQQRRAERRREPVTTPNSGPTIMDTMHCASVAAIVKAGS